jgi:hypothetical protein
MPWIKLASVSIPQNLKFSIPDPYFKAQPERVPLKMGTSREI